MPPQAAWRYYALACVLLSAHPGRSCEALLELLGGAVAERDHLVANSQDYLTAWELRGEMDAQIGQHFAAVWDDRIKWISPFPVSHWWAPRGRPCRRYCPWHTLPYFPRNMLRELPTLSEPLAACLLAVFDADLHAEQNARMAFGRGRRHGAGNEWHWLPYAPGWMLQRILGAQAEASLRGLEESGLVDLSDREYAHFGPYLHVRLTRLGRALARTLRGIRPKRWPAGRLREWQWAALVVACQAGEKGLSGGVHSNPGKIAWHTWLQLRDHQPTALIETLRDVQPFGLGLYRLRLTNHGRVFYREHWQEYRHLYPAVEAPAP